MRPAFQLQRQSGVSDRQAPKTALSAEMVLASCATRLQWVLQSPFFPAIPEKSSMSQLIVRAGEFAFQARFEEELAPKTVAAFRKAMPFESQAIHVRWSGEGVWMPLGDLDFGVSYENHTSYPAPGQIILYPGGISETEILLAYGGVHFASKMGQLAGNHFITLTSGLENLATFGKTVLWKGAQKIRFEEA
jgi:Protein of unknown function (DUF3830)